MPQPDKPDDELFRLVFRDPAHAAPYLAAVLPPDLVRHLDLRTLTPLPTDFIDAKLDPQQSDALFSVRQLGHPAPVYVLLCSNTSGPRRGL